MQNPIKLYVQRISHEIKDSVSSRPRQVEPGCLIKVPLARTIGETNTSGENDFVYGVVGQHGIIVNYRNHTPTIQYFHWMV